MADEENPLGGGTPFGVGPFGPLIPTVAVAVAASILVPITIGTIFTKTLYYQALVQPPPTAQAAAAAFEAFPAKWMPRWQGPPKYQPNRGPFAAYAPFEPPVVVDNINAATGITTGGVFSRTLFYQSKIYGIAPPVEVVVDVTIDKWLVPFSRAPTRPPTETALYTPFVPQAAQPPTADKWLQPFKRQVAGPFPVHTQPVLAYQPIAVSNLTTTLEWMPAWLGTKRPLLPLAGGVVNVPLPSNLTTTLEWQVAWRGPPRSTPAPQGGQSFVPKEATLENTLTGIPWLMRWQGAVPVPAVHPTQPFYGYPYVAASTLTTTLEWMVAWQGPPRYQPPRIAAQPFVPREAVLENTVTPDKWLFRFQVAVPVPPVHHTQPFLGYPYAAASNLTTSLEWMSSWQGPPRYWPIKVQALPFVPKADVVDQVTPDKWLIKWQGPPNYNPAPAGGSPFIPKEAVLENTVTPDKWLVRFTKAVPVPRPIHTQPFLGYPYTSQAIVVPYEQWWHQPLSRPAARPSVHAKPYQPFVPKEAVAENTQTPDKWLQRWQGPPRYRPIKVQTPPFVPREATRENTQTPDKWHRDLGRAVAKPPVTHTQPGWSYGPPIVQNTVTIEKWQQPLSRAAAVPKSRPTQPVYAPTEPAAAVVVEELGGVFSVTTTFLARKTLYYQDLTFGYPYEQVVPVCIPAAQLTAFQFDAFQTCADEQALEGGPSDEPERVICVLPQSRQATVPEVLRTITVHYERAAPPACTTAFQFGGYQFNAFQTCTPVHLRVATVPALSRVVEVPASNRDEDANEFNTLPCAGPIIPQTEEDAFQHGTFEGDAFQ